MDADEEIAIGQVHFGRFGLTDGGGWWCFHRMHSSVSIGQVYNVFENIYHDCYQTFSSYSHCFILDLNNQSKRNHCCALVIVDCFQDILSNYV